MAPRTDQEAATAPDEDLRRDIADALHRVFPLDCHETDADNCIACQERAHAVMGVLAAHHIGPETA